MGANRRRWTVVGRLLLKLVAVQYTGWACFIGVRRTTAAAAAAGDAAEMQVVRDGVLLTLDSRAAGPCVRARACVCVLEADD